MGRKVTYTDAEGRKWLRGLPDNAPDEQARIGVPLGPPSLCTLGLPKDAEIRLHNQLFDRGLFTVADVNRDMNQLSSALVAAFKVDAHTIASLYTTPAEVTNADSA